MSRYPVLDRRQLEHWRLDERGHDMTVEQLLPLEPPRLCFERPDFGDIVRAIVAAQKADRPVVAIMGGHPIKLGLSQFLLDLMERKLITHIATNGAFIIHDFELSLAGGTSENVAKWIQAGQLGLWHETSRLNDIIHAMPNCEGAALGKASYTDFLIFARTIQDLEGGVFLNIGSAVTGPEVYLKALSMARNVARQQGQEIRHFTTAVFDLVDLPNNFRDGPPGKDHPLYYYRPWKTILCRTIVDGGTSYYFKGDHKQTIPTLWHELVKRTDHECIERLARQSAPA